MSMERPPPESIGAGSWLSTSELSRKNVNLAVDVLQYLGLNPSIPNPGPEALSVSPGIALSRSLSAGDLLFLEVVGFRVVPSSAPAGEAVTPCDPTPEQTPRAIPPRNAMVTERTELPGHTPEQAGPGASPTSSPSPPVSTVTTTGGESAVVRSRWPRIFKLMATAVGLGLGVLGIVTIFRRLGALERLNAHELSRLKADLQELRGAVNGNQQRSLTGAPPKNYDAAAAELAKLDAEFDAAFAEIDAAAEKNRS